MKLKKRADSQRSRGHGGVDRRKQIINVETSFLVNINPLLSFFFFVIRAQPYEP